jgi:hypothetical protein
LQIKGLLKLPSKKAQIKSYMNQWLTPVLEEMPSVPTGLGFMAHRSTGFVHK